MWKATYHKKVMDSDVPKLSGDIRLRIQKAIKEKIETRPDIFGKPLQHSLAGCRSVRVGEYRIIFVLLEKKRESFIVYIGHRSVSYDKVMPRV